MKEKRDWVDNKTLKGGPIQNTFRFIGMSAAGSSVSPLY